jgi:hypothetical protein
MDKQIKLYVGIGLLGVGAYLYWKSTQSKANALGKPRRCPKGWTLNPEGTMCVQSTTMTAKGGYGGSILPKMPKYKMDALPHTIQSVSSSTDPYGDVPMVDELGRPILHNA